MSGFSPGFSVQAGRGRDGPGHEIFLAEFYPDDYLDSSVKLRPGEKWRVEKTWGGTTLKLAHLG